MTDEHEAIRELLAAHTLNGLDEAEAARAQRVLSEHVPGCATCAASLQEFQRAAGDLALAAPPRRPPALLRRRLLREIRPERRLRWLPAASVAVAVAVLAGMATWNARLNDRVSLAEQRQVRTTEVLAAVSHPQSQVVPLSPERGPTIGIQLAAAFVPGRPMLYLFGSMPYPHSGRVYQVWLIQGAQFQSAGTFVPDGGMVLLRIQADPSVYDGLLITEEPASGSERPSNARIVTASL